MNIGNVSCGLEYYGKHAGKATCFITFARCNHNCDTCSIPKYRTEEFASSLTSEELWFKLKTELQLHNAINRVSITGGNPMLQIVEIAKFLTLVCESIEKHMYPFVNIKEVNFEHPGLLPKESFSPLNQDIMFLVTLFQRLNSLGIKVTINIDIKYPLLEKFLTEKYKKQDGLYISEVEQILLDYAKNHMMFANFLHDIGYEVSVTAMMQSHSDFSNWLTSCCAAIGVVDDTNFLFEFRPGIYKYISLLNTKSKGLKSRLIRMLTTNEDTIGWNMNMSD